MGAAVPVDDLPGGVAVPDDDLPTSTAAGARPRPMATASIHNPVNDWVSGFFNRSVSGPVGAAAGGLRGIWDLALGRGVDRATADIGATQQAVSDFGTPQTDAGRLGAAASESSWNPLNWPGVALSWTGKKLGSLSESMGGSPGLSAALETAPTAAAMLTPIVRGAMKADWKPYQVEAEQTPPPGSSQSISAASADGGAVAIGGHEPLGPPVEGGLSKSAAGLRAETLARVGIQNARESAIAGDAKSAAVDYQMTKYDQPAGRAAAAQFQAERDALATHAENMIGDAGGTIGMDEDALSSRGAAISQPFGLMRQWFANRMRQLYAEADQRSAAGAGSYYVPGEGGGTALTNLESVDKMLADPSFQNTLAARDQQGLLSAVQRQLEFFRKNSPNGFSAAGAEQFRQWLNQVWSPDNRWAIGQLKDAIDTDVTSAAGQDIYAQARAIKQLESRTFDTPGISDLFDIDPKTGESVLDHAQIPDRLTRLPPGKFSNVIDALHDMPEELQPAAQAALGEIKGHLLNKVLQAGTQTSRGVGAQVWGADRVSQVLRTNASKFRIALADEPELQNGLEDISNAGQILRVDQSYPGADAQAANAMKRGLISRTLGHLGGSAGAAAGAAIAGPLGAAAGGAAGESLGLSAGARASERAALKSWGKRIRPTETKP